MYSMIRNPEVAVEVDFRVCHLYYTSLTYQATFVPSFAGHMPMYHWCSQKRADHLPYGITSS
jgi:hypothetical protein